MLGQAVGHVIAGKGLSGHALATMRAEIEKAVGYALVRSKFGKRGVSDEDETLKVLAIDVARAMRVAGIEPTSWQVDDTDQESAYHKLVRAAATASRLNCPVHLRASIRAARNEWTPSGRYDLPYLPGDKIR